MFEIELAKAQVEHEEPIIVGFFIFQYAKLRILELYHNFFTRFCDITKFEDSLYLALAEKELEDCTRPEKRDEGQRLRSNDCIDSFTADAVANFFPRTNFVKHKQHDKREPGLLKEEFRCTEIRCLCSRTCCCHDATSDKLKFSSKDLNKRVLEQSGDGLLERYRRVLNEKINFISNKRGFRTNKHSVATYEHFKKKSVLLSFTQNEQSRVMELTRNQLTCEKLALFSFYNVVYLSNFIKSNYIF